MRKLVYVALVIMAITVVSCGGNSASKTTTDKDSTTCVTDSVKSCCSKDSAQMAKCCKTDSTFKCCKGDSMKMEGKCKSDSAKTQGCCSKAVK